MENFLGGMEYFFSLGFLVDLGNFYAAKCADIGGDWVSTASGSWECVNTDLDAKVGDWIASIR